MKTYECNGCDKPCFLSFEVVYPEGLGPTYCPLGHDDEQVLWVEKPASITPVQGDCQYRWVSMKNKVIESGEYCLKCHAVRATP